MFSKATIEEYFHAEKAESRVFIVIGIAAIITALLFFFIGKIHFYKGAAIPLVLIGLLLAVVGYTIYKRSDNDRKRNVYAFDMNPAELKDKELPRMKAVMKNFVLYRYTEIFFVLAGAFLYIYFSRDVKHSFWQGFGLALAIMALIALTADYFAESRGKIYTSGLESFVK